MAEPDKLVQVNGWSITDANCTEVIERLVRLGLAHDGALGVGLHVSALGTDERENARRSAWVDLAYTDGISTAALARLAGARRVEKTTTTYIAADVLNGISRRAHRPVQVALVGGPPGLAEKAIPGLLRQAHAKVVYTCGGYAGEDEWGDHLTRLRAVDPDVVFVGLGHPREVDWCIRHRQAFPNALVLTCGGLFGYLAGYEAPAPPLMRRLGFEWVWRTCQDPRRLLPRYLLGMWNFVVVGARVVRTRTGWPRRE